REDRSSIAVLCSATNGFSSIYGLDVFLLATVALASLRRSPVAVGRVGLLLLLLIPEAFGEGGRGARVLGGGSSARRKESSAAAGPSPGSGRAPLRTSARGPAASSPISATVGARLLSGDERRFRLLPCLTVWTDSMLPRRLDHEAELDGIAVATGEEPALRRRSEGASLRPGR
ncbi:hypothetical protein ACHAWF_004783, partial [Thalassiosira exigua]